MSATFRTGNQASYFAPMMGRHYNAAMAAAAFDRDLDYGRVKRDAAFVIRNREVTLTDVGFAFCGISAVDA